MMQTVRRFDASLGSILEDGGKIMFFIFSGVALLVCLRYQLLAIPHPFSLDYGEAPLVDQAMRLASGQNIYRADLSSPPYTISNYPPLYVSLLAIGVKLFGPAGAFFFGRTISVISAWAAAIFLILIVYAQTRDRIAAYSAGLVLLAFPFVVYWSPLLRIDMLALALSLAGLCLLVWKPVTPRRLIGVALLLTAAIFTRQSYGLAAPFAAFVWLVVRDWRQALRLALLVGGLSLFLFLLLNTLTRGGFFFNIVTANVNEFKLDLLKFNGERLKDAAFLLLCLAGISLILIPRWNPLWTLAVPYLIGATISAATIGKIGSNVNYLMELCAALSLAAGVVVAWSRVHLPFHTLRAALLVLLAFAVVQMVRTTLQDYTWDLRERRAARTELAELKALVAETPGAILADEYMGMLTLNGRPLTIQPFEVTQLAWAGTWDQTPLLESIRDKEFGAIILYDRPWVNERWTAEMLEAITQSYILVDIVAENKIYKPADRAVTVTATVDACPEAPWRLPSDGSLGIQLVNDGIDFFGNGKEASTPVYAVADGILTRRPEWVDAVAILHEDPLRPGEKVWAYYGGMAAASGTDSFVAQDFPPGITDIPVKSGQLLGYQGTWSGTPQWPKWVHMFIALVDAHGKSSQPQNITSADLLDPAPYLGLIVESGKDYPQPLKCKEP
jgi:4-amino-4-deoxy-L-arabinose transferase-like glycosyltransferase